VTLSVFAPEALTKAVHDALATVPDGHTNAVVGTVDQFGVHVAVGFSRPGPGSSEWNIQAAATHQWSGDTQIGGKVILSW